LLASVDAAMAAGDLDRAAALCERALRIAPRDGQLWLKLGTIRQRQGRTADARGFAQRALSLAGGDAQLERQSRVLLELLELDEAGD
jgi:Flp pilus assembly protein TadD